MVCPRCGAEMRIIAFITGPSVLRDVLVHLGEPTTPPRIAPARGPPLCKLPIAGAGGGDPKCCGRQGRRVAREDSDSNAWR